MKNSVLQLPHHNGSSGICIFGRYLCPVAQRLWDEATSLYHQKRYDEHDQKIVEYHKHQSRCAIEPDAYSRDAMPIGV